MRNSTEVPGAADLSAGTRYTMAEAARIKGVSYHTVSRAVRSGKLPAQRLGRMALISAQDLQAWRPMRERAPRKYRRPEPSDDMLDERPVLADTVGSTTYIDRLVLAGEQLMEVSSAEYTGHFGPWLAQWLAASLRHDAAVIWRADPGGEGAELFGAYGVDAELLPKRMPDRSMEAVRRLTHGGAPIGLDRNASRQAGVDVWLPRPLDSSVLLIPLVAGNRTVGYGVVAGDGSQDPLSEGERSFAQRLGLQAGFAIEHVELRQASQKELLGSPTVFDELPIQLLAVDRHGTIVYANQEFTRLWGEEVQARHIGRHYSHFLRTFRCETLDGVKVPLEEHPITRGLLGETMNEVRYHVPEALGEAHVFSLSTRLVLDSEGNQTGVVLTARDVTDELEDDGDPSRTPMEMLTRARRRVEALAHLLTEIAQWHDGEDIFALLARRSCEILDADSSVVVMPNDAGTMVIRATHNMPDGVVGRSMSRLRFPSALLAMARRDLYYVSEDEAGAGGRELLREGGAKLALLIPLVDGEEALGVLAMHYTDVTRLQQVDADLARAVGRQIGHAVHLRTVVADLEASRRRLLATLDQLPQAIVILDDHEGHIVAMNREAQQVWGDHVGDYGGEIPFVDEQGAAVPLDRHPLIRALHTRRTELAVPLVTRDVAGGLVDVLANISPIVGRSGELRGVAAVVQRREHFRQIDRARDEFISVVAHEIRNPLTSLRGNLQMLERRLGRMDSGDARREVERVHALVDQVDRVGDLVSSLLDVSRADLGKLTVNPTDSDAVQLAKDAISDIVGQLDGRSVTFSGPETLPVTWDDVRIRQILANLLSNAVRYAEKGDVEVKVRPAGSDRVTVSVRDHGPGIPPRLRPHLFHLYHRFDDGEETSDALATRQRGLGIGLYISARIAHAHGGELTVDDAEGGGAIFTLSLPRTAASEGG